MHADGPLSPTILHKQKRHNKAWAQPLNTISPLPAIGACRATLVLVLVLVLVDDIMMMTIMMMPTATMITMMMRIVTR